MNTKFSEIYALFLSQIDDYELAQADEEDVNFVLRGYLNTGFVHIYDIFSDMDMLEDEFNQKLSMAEKLICAYAMKVAWQSEKLNSEELMRKAIGDRDYNAVQGNGYLKELRALNDSLRNELRQLKYDYTYNSKDSFGELA